MGALILWVNLAFAAEAERPSDDLDRANAQVAELLAQSDVDQKAIYCAPGKLDCRTHYFLKDKSGKRIEAFFVTFVSADRQMGGTGYFIPNGETPGQFHRFEDFSFDGVKKVTVVNTDVEVVLGDDGVSFTMPNLNIPRLGTTRYVLGELKAEPEITTIIGTEMDTQDPSIQIPFKLQYNRYRP